MTSNYILDLSSAFDMNVKGNVTVITFVTSMHLTKRGR